MLDLGPQWLDRVIVPVRGVSCIYHPMLANLGEMVIVPVRGVSCIRFNHAIIHWRHGSSSP